VLLFDHQDRARDNYKEKHMPKMTHELNDYFEFGVVGY